MSLTSDQELAVKAISKFISNDKIESTDDIYFSLAGAAGTGKTFLLHHILSIFCHLKFAIATPTHQAKAVVKSRVSSATVSTLASMFKFGTTLNLETLERTFKKTIAPEAFNNFDICIIEEASMIDNETIEALMLTAFDKRKKIIFVGDKYQLNSPSDTTNTSVNLAFADKNNTVTLNKIVRQKNESILSLVILTIRRALSANLFPEEFAAIDDDYDDLIHRLNMPKNNFKNPIDYLKLIYKDAFYSFDKYKEYLAKGDREDEDFWEKTKTLAFTNASVANINNGIRKLLKKSFIEHLDIIKSYENTTDLTNGIEYRIYNPQSGYINFDTVVNNTVQTFKLKSFKCWLNADKTNYITIIDHNDESTVKSMFSIKESFKHWKPKDDKSKNSKLYTVNSFKNLCLLESIKRDEEIIQPNIAFAYSFTVHKSQGTTIENVIVDYEDFKNCKDNITRLRLLYVALSRASKNLIILQ